MGSMSPPSCGTVALAWAGAVPALQPPQLLPGWVHGQESDPAVLHTSVWKVGQKHCASPSVKEGGGDGGESHPLP